MISQDSQAVQNVFASQHSALLKELEAESICNAWYESELLLAGKAGYQTSTTKSIQEMTAPNDDDILLIEALITLCARPAEVQAYGYSFRVV